MARAQQSFKSLVQIHEKNGKLFINSFETFNFNNFILLFQDGSHPHHQMGNLQFLPPQRQMQQQKEKEKLCVNNLKKKKLIQIFDFFMFLIFNLV